MIERAIRAYLRNSNTVRDKVGTRIYAGNAPRGVGGNYVLLRVVSADHIYDLSDEMPIRQTNLQIDCYDETRTLADELAESVRHRLSGFRGLADTVFVQAVTIIRDTTLEVPPADASDRWIYLRSMDLSIHHEAAAPNNYQ